MSNWFNETQYNNKPFYKSNNSIFNSNSEGFGNKSTFDSTNTSFQQSTKSSPFFSNAMSLEKNDIKMNDNDEFKNINDKLTEIKKEIDILKYKESTRHIVHQGIICNNCNKNNIHGIRFKCFTCQEYNICEDCERYLSYVHDNSHFFIRIHDTSLFNNMVLQQQQQQQHVNKQQKLF